MHLYKSDVVVMESVVRNVTQRTHTTDPCRTFRVGLSSAGFQFNQMMNGSGGGGAGGVFFTGGFSGFGGGAQMSAPGRQPTDGRPGQTGSQVQRQLFHIGMKRGRRGTVCLWALLLLLLLLFTAKSPQSPPKVHLYLTLSLVKVRKLKLNIFFSSKKGKYSTDVLLSHFSP